MTQRAHALVALVALLSLLVGCAAREPAPAEQASADRGVAPLFARGQAAEQRQDWDAAIAAYSEALERTPWNTRFQRLLAVAHAERAARARRAGAGEAGLRAAEVDLRRAIELDASDLTFHRNLGVVLLELAAYESDDARRTALREEGTRLAPDASVPDVQRSVERRLDLALELIERDQVETGIAQLEALRAEEPDRPDVARLLAQAHVRAGNALVARHEPRRAAESFTRAVALYAALAPCDGARCTRDDQRAAHQNRIVALYESGDPAAARAALAEAEAAGLRFPELRQVLR